MDYESLEGIGEGWHEFLEGMTKPELIEVYTDAMKILNINSYRIAGLWTPFNWDDTESHPPKPGRYLIYRRGCDKKHFEQWNGSGWSSSKDCTHWADINTPSERLK